MSNESAKPQRNAVRETHTDPSEDLLSLLHHQDGNLLRMHSRTPVRCTDTSLTDLELVDEILKLMRSKDETDARLVARKESNVRHHAARSPSFPRFWELLGWGLPRNLRRTVFEPYRHELLEDYLVSQKQSRTPAARWWLTFCYTLWTIYALVATLVAALTQPATQRLLKLIPDRWKQWWYT